MLSRKCACGANISVNRSICGDCATKYGNDQNEWPEWLKFLVCDNQKEMNRSVRHSELELFENEQYQPISNIAKYNLVRARKFPEMEFDEFSWFNQ